MSRPTVPPIEPGEPARSRWKGPAKFLFAAVVLTLVFRALLKHELFEPRSSLRSSFCFFARCVDFLLPLFRTEFPELELLLLL